MELNIATNIETDIFYLIVKLLKDNGWELIAEYDENIFDKGIDFDLYQFRKNSETILLAWSNWFEGEMKATTKTLTEIAEQFNINLKFEEPQYLNKPGIIDEMKGLITFKI